ncbi:MAG: TldD/PmbA family protein [Firmicutes bacterium]|nr:TldD/PmbA family protein [Bacillota bacterium]MBR0481832.1 TldD/PmbA family protein [Bacillota bacterium]
MEVARSNYIAENKALFRRLQQELSARFEYASVLVCDGRQQNYRVSAQGVSIADANMFGRKGFVARVYDGRAYAEYAGNEISEEGIGDIVRCIEGSLLDMGEEWARYTTPVLDEEEACFIKNTEYRIHPEELGDEKIIAKLSDIREKTKALDERLIDCMASLQYQYYNKLFLSDKKDIEENVMWTCGGLVVLATRGEELKDAYKGFSVLGGAELLDEMESYGPKIVKTCIDLLDSEPMIPGEYECVCSPEVTGMIVHEAFGHGVEMDMFVKDRAMAKDCMGDMIASDLVTMRDGAACGPEVASFFFDDEGTLAHDTLVIDRGRLVSGYADAVSAARLGVEPTGNGRRESVERKVYTRMTNTFFEGGKDKVEDMIASVKYGMLLQDPSSGMEDPKNWGIQCMVSIAREIKDGKLTGRIFSPCVLTGYVPDLLKSISMMSETVELGGSGACGKGHKEWVKVSDGGPWIKAKIRLG